MLELPQNCLVDRFIPKKTFYERVNISTILKKEFIDNLEKIIWKYKISQDNLNIAKTDEIEEIEILELFLKEKCDVKNIIKVITKEIPYPILFKINYKNEYMFAIKYESDIIQTEWNENIEISINGLDLNAVYENLVKQIAGIDNNSIDVKKELEKIKEIELLEKEINKLKSNIEKEKQFNRKVELNKKVRKLEKEMEELKSE